MESEKAHVILLRIFSFGIFFFYLTLSIESSIFSLPDVINEHRLYLPSYGFILSSVSLVCLIFQFLENCYRKRQKEIKKIYIFITLTIIFAFSYLTFQRNKVWQSEISLWSDVVSKSPQKVRPHIALGVSYANVDRNEEAVKELLYSLELNNMQIIKFQGLSDKYKSEGNLSKAGQAYQQALNKIPLNAYIYANLGNISYRQNWIEQAIEYYLMVLKLDPDSAVVYERLGVMYLQKGETNKAIESFQRAIEFDANSANAYYNLGVAFRIINQKNQAIESFKKAVELRPFFEEANQNLKLLQNQLNTP